MLIVCPKCFTQYLISDEIKLTENQKFHCSFCQNYFTQKTDRPQEVHLNSVGYGEVTTGDGAPVNPNPQSGNGQTDTATSLPEPKDVSSEGDSLFGRPFSLSDDEKSNQEIRLDSIPEEFQPVEPTKKTSFLSLLVLLGLVGGICYTAYIKKDFLFEQIDTLIMTQLRGDTPVSSLVETSSSDMEVSAVDAAVSSSVKDEPSAAEVFAQPVVQTESESTTNSPEVVPEQVASSENASVVESSNTSNLPETGSLDGQNLSQAASSVTVSEPAKENIIVDSLALLEGQENTGEETQVLEAVVSPVEVNNAGATEPLNPTQDISLPVVTEQSSSEVLQSPDKLKDILKVQSISYEISPNEVGLNRLIVRGEIVNTELKEFSLPEYKAVVYDEHDIVVARKKVVLTQPALSGNSTLPFETAVVPAPQTVSRVEVVFDE